MAINWTHVHKNIYSSRLVKEEFEYFKNAYPNLISELESKVFFTLSDDFESAINKGLWKPHYSKMLKGATFPVNSTYEFSFDSIPSHLWYVLFFMMCVRIKVNYSSSNEKADSKEQIDDKEEKTLPEKQDKNTKNFSIEFSSGFPASESVGGFLAKLFENYGK